jgi:hypothetical protein
MGVPFTRAMEMIDAYVASSVLSLKMANPQIRVDDSWVAGKNGGGIARCWRRSAFTFDRTDGCDGWVGRNRRGCGARY